MTSSVDDRNGIVGVRTLDDHSDSFITVTDLKASWDGETLAIDGLNMRVRKGEFVAVLGPSGSGKSTLLHVISGLLRPVGGSAQINGVTVERLKEHDDVRIGYVFQDHRLLPWRTVRQNIELVLASAKVPADEWGDRIDHYLHLLGVGALRDAWPLRLSGGQRQRVSIARALAIRPAVILMDEPFSSLDEVTARIMRQELVDLWLGSEQTIIFVTHSIHEAAFLANRIVILTTAPGRVLEEVSVTYPHPRQYEDPRLIEMEGTIVGRVLEAWGYTRAADRT